MLPVLLLLFILVPIAEIYVIIQVGQALGALATVALLIVDSILGAMLMRSQGRAVWRRFNLALAEGRAPAREVADGALVLFGGALLLTPGFITDVFGAVFLLPPTRAALRRLLLRLAGRRFVVATPFGPVRPGDRGPRMRRPRGAQGWDVDGTAHEVDRGPERLGR